MSISQARIARNFCRTVTTLLPNSAGADVLAPAVSDTGDEIQPSRIAFQSGGTERRHRSMPKCLPVAAAVKAYHAVVDDHA